MIKCKVRNLYSDQAGSKQVVHPLNSLDLGRVFSWAQKQLACSLPVRVSALITYFTFNHSDAQCLPQERARIKLKEIIVLF